MQLSLSFLILINCVFKLFCLECFSPSGDTASVSKDVLAPAFVPPQGDHSFDKDDNDFDVEAFVSTSKISRGRVDEGQLDSSDTSKLNAVSQNPAHDVVMPPAPLLHFYRPRDERPRFSCFAGWSYGDDSLSDLWTLWFPGARLRRWAFLEEALTGQGPTSWDEAEKLLRQLIERYGVYWAEPLTISQLFIHAGRMDAETLCKMSCQSNLGILVRFRVSS
jgi:hypothetical protein